MLKKKRSEKMQRRTVLQLLSAGIVCSAVTGVPLLSSAQEKQKIAKETRFILGTVASIELRSNSEMLCSEAIEKAFLRAEKERMIFDRHAHNTALSVLNDIGRLSAAPKQLQTLLHTAQYYEKQTGGLFNPTVYAFVEQIEKGIVPTIAMRKKYKESITSSYAILFDKETIILPRNVKLTLDGIAKGYIIDAMAQTLEANGVQDYIVNVGGDIRVAGTKEDGSAWDVGIQVPKKYTNALIATTTMSSGALATSGVYERNVHGNVSVSHLINPYTGNSPQYILSASVKARTAVQADALATAIMFMEPQQAIRTIEHHNAACLLCTTQGKLYTSSRWNA